MSRVSWDRYFLQIAEQVATRATCPRRHVGCVLVAENRIVSTGYNGSIPGAPHCDESGCVIKNEHCVRTIHAEVNAIATAARMGVATIGTTAYVTVTPCWPCFKMMVSAGIYDVRYGSEYNPDRYVQEAAMEFGIFLSRIDPNG